MAKNPGRGNKIFRRNTIPNLVGQLTTTAQSTLTSLGFNSTVTNESTGDQSLNNKVKTQSLTGEAALGTSVSLVNYTFSFSPFGAFGFTPFGFTPFGAFGFTPWSVGPCIHEETLIRTPNGDVPAKNLQIDDVVTSIDIAEIPLHTDNSSDYDWRSVAIETVTTQGTVNVNITGIVPSTVQEVVWFNGESETKFSLNHPMFIKGDPFYVFIESGGVQVGDILIKVAPDGSLIEVPITSVDTDDSSHTVLSFSCEPQDWFIAGDYLTHNK